MTGFEPATPSPPVKCASQTAPHPVSKAFRLVQDLPQHPICFVECLFRYGELLALLFLSLPALAEKGVGFLKPLTVLLLFFQELVDLRLM